MTETLLSGGCHCRNIAFGLRCTEEAQPTVARRCDCTFCRPRGARWVSPPGATLEIAFGSAPVSRYSFASRTAQFWICSRCGSVPLATSEIDGRLYAVVNAEAFTKPVPGLESAPAAAGAGEAIEQKLARRKQTWIGNVYVQSPGGTGTCASHTQFTTSRTILFGDCDPGGIIYTPRVAHYVVEAAMEFMHARTGTSAGRTAMQSGIWPPARLLSIEYLSPLTFDDTVDISVRVETMRDRSLALGITARRLDQSVAFHARLVMVFVSGATMQPVAVPPELRAKLQA